MSLQINKMFLFASILLLLLLTINWVYAMPSPDSYDDGQCELIAKDYQKEFGGDLIFIQPLKDNGAYDLGEFNGHWLNKAWDNNMGNYYIDYESQTYLHNPSEIKDWYKTMTDKESVVFDVNQGGLPFALIYHY